MQSCLYRQSFSREPVRSSPQITPVSEEEIEETKKGLIEYAEKTLPAFEANHRYLRENYADLLKEYPEQWIAVHEQRVVANAPSMAKIFTTINQLGIDRHFTVVEFLNTDSRPLIL